ncbi:squamosa promoter-binding-like protein 6 isoform X2 [Humulus lupulus]|uniref:squamosa promoter-binding-like protein 6 isoform X2 n=1 Tax=Humulus lupulus TaxID=3486 RepID=UPI002B401F75|nr:squamosa promoter-binding-like protein 6 isoform X2 [Humulus lupulus]
MRFSLPIFIFFFKRSFVLCFKFNSFRVTLRFSFSNFLVARRVLSLISLASATWDSDHTSMVSWNFASEGKALLFSDDIDWSDAFSRNRKALIQCENGLVPGRESVESLEYMELGFPEMLRKTIQSSQGLEMLCGGEVGNGSFHRAASPACLISPNSSLVEDESGSNSKVSSSFMEFNSQDSPLIALKLGRFGDCRNSQNSEHPKDKTVSSPSLVVKRARIRGSYSQTPFCQVHGCNMDLSTSKDYHKKHKVCDVHSKTSKVILNGIEQRFCQQCSRFHLLAEFDDGKRSCRRRLVGHNERRRKPQLDGLSDKPHKFSHAYQGTRYPGTSLQKRTPFVFSDILPGVILSPEKFEQANPFGHIKFEEEPIYSPQLTIPVKNAQMFSNSLIHPHSSGVPSSETEDYCFHTAATIHKTSGASNSACALSLLSAHSHNFSSHSAGIPNESPMTIQGSHQTISQLSEKPLRLRSMERHGSNGFYSCGMNPIGVDQFEPTVFTETSQTADFEVPADRSFQNSNCLDTKYSLSLEHESTVDLLQLSSHLQRVEHQRNFMPVKQENEDFCCFPTA